MNKLIIVFGIIGVLGIFLFFLGVSFLGGDESDNYYLLEFKSDGERMVLGDLSIEKGYFEEQVSRDRKYEVRLISDNGENLYSYSFNSELVFTDELRGDALTGGAIVNWDSFFVKLPVLEESEKIEILNKETGEIAEYRLSELVV